MTQKGNISRILKVGVTGGIGSGKTTVCRIFSSLGIPVFSADNEARIIMDTDPGVIEKVNGLAGKNMYTSGLLDRAEMASLIFRNRAILENVNRIVHPKVVSRFLSWSEDQAAPYVILEAAVLFESGSFNILDRIITVTAPVEERILRVVRRNNLTREQVLERISNQSDDSEKISRSDYVIDNSDNMMILPVVLSIHEDLLNPENRK